MAEAPVPAVWASLIDIQLCVQLTSQMQSALGSNKAGPLIVHQFPLPGGRQGMAGVLVGSGAAVAVARRRRIVGVIFFSDSAAALQHNRASRSGIVVGTHHNMRPLKTPQ